MTYNNHVRRLITTCLLLSSLTSPNGLALAQDESANIRGIKLYRQQKYQEALAAFRLAVDRASSESEKITALENMSLVFLALDMAEQYWQAKHDAWLLRQKLEGCVIPLEFDAPTKADADRKVSDANTAAVKAAQLKKMERENKVKQQAEMMRAAPVSYNAAPQTKGSNLTSFPNWQDKSESEDRQEEKRVRRLRLKRIVVLCAGDRNIIANPPTRSVYDHTDYREEAYYETEYDSYGIPRQVRHYRTIPVRVYRTEKVPLEELKDLACVRDIEDLARSYSLSRSEQQLLEYGIKSDSAAVFELVEGLLLYAPESVKEGTWFSGEDVTISSRGFPWVTLMSLERRDCVSAKIIAGH